MAVYRKHTLQRAIDIQNITLAQTARGISQRYIYLHEIKPVYHISERTYYRYLSLPAKKLIKELFPDK